MGIGTNGTRLFNRYALRDKLADSSRGEVWSALDEFTEETVALELLAHTSVRSAEDWSRVRRSHLLAARLAHSNILAIYEPLRSESTTAIPMQFARGGNARKLIGAPYYESLPILIDVAEALRHAHRLGIAHLDLSLRNVLLDESNCALLKGFGFEGGAPQEFDAATRKDLRDFATLGIELISGPLPERRAAPPRLRALFDQIYDSSFALQPMSFDEIVAELDASRHDTAPLTADSIDFGGPTRILAPAAVRRNGADECSVDAKLGVPQDRAEPTQAPLLNQAAIDTNEPEPQVWVPPDSANDPCIAAGPDLRGPESSEISDAWVEGSSASGEAAGQPAAVVTPHAADAVAIVSANSVAGDRATDSADDSLLHLEPAPTTRLIAAPSAGSGAVGVRSEQDDQDNGRTSDDWTPYSRAARINARRRAIIWRFTAGSVAIAIISGAVWLSGRNPPPAGGGLTASRVAAPTPSSMPVAATTAPAGSAAAPNLEAMPVAAAGRTASAAWASGKSGPMERSASPAERETAATKPEAVKSASHTLRSSRHGRAALPLLTDAQRAESAGDLNRAAQGYGQVLTVDRNNRQARAGIARLRRAAGNDAFATALIGANAALGGGRLDAAREGFARALELRPNDERARAGHERAEAALTARRLAPLLRRAAALERDGDWGDALRIYEEILTIQPDYVLAQQGRQRSSLRAASNARPSIGVVSGSAVGNGG